MSSARPASSSGFRRPAATSPLSGSTFLRPSRQSPGWRPGSPRCAAGGSFDGFASWCYTRAIRENESQAAFTLRTMGDKPEQAGSGKPGGPTTILVVDDSQEVRDLLRTVLQHHGYEVVLA